MKSFGILSLPYFAGALMLLSCAPEAKNIGAPTYFSVANQTTKPVTVFSFFGKPLADEVGAGTDFADSVKLKSPAFVRIVHNRQESYLWLSPGDSISVELPEKKVSFGGRSQSGQEAVNAIVEKVGQLPVVNLKNPGTFLNRIDSIYGSIDVNGSGKPLDAFSETLIQSWHLHQLYRFNTHWKSDSAQLLYDKRSGELIKKLDSIGPGITDIPAVFQFVESHLKWEVATSDQQEVDFTTENEQLFNAELAQLLQLDVSGRFRQRVQYHLLKAWIVNRGFYKTSFSKLSHFRKFQNVSYAYSLSKAADQIAKGRDKVAGFYTIWRPDSTEAKFPYSDTSKQLWMFFNKWDRATQDSLLKYRTEYKSFENEQNTTFAVLFATNSARQLDQLNTPFFSNRAYAVPTGSMVKICSQLSIYRLPKCLWINKDQKVVDVLPVDFSMQNFYADSIVHLPIQ